MDYSHLRNRNGGREEGSLRNRNHNCQQCENQAAIAPGWELFSSNSETGDDSMRRDEHLLQRSDSRQRITPLCAEAPNLRVFSYGYPVAIQSFRLISPERRSNPAHPDTLTVTPFGSWEALCASYPGLSLLLSPGLHRPATSHCYRDRLRRS